MQVPQKACEHHSYTHMLCSSPFGVRGGLLHTRRPWQHARWRTLPDQVHLGVQNIRLVQYQHPALCCPARCSEWCCPVDLHTLHVCVLTAAAASLCWLGRPWAEQPRLGGSRQGVLGGCGCVGRQWPCPHIHMWQCWDGGQPCCSGLQLLSSGSGGGAAGDVHGQAAQEVWGVRGLKYTLVCMRVIVPVFACVNGGWWWWWWWGCSSPRRTCRRRTWRMWRRRCHCPCP